MRRFSTIFSTSFSTILGISLFLLLVSVSALAQTDKLVGRWEGKLQGPQGERDTWATFKKEGDAVVGTMPGMRPGSENKLTDVKIEGDKITAKANVETPNGALTISYSFKLEGDTLNGQGSLDFSGQSFTFDINLKRAAANAAAAPPATAGQTAAPAPAAGPGSGPAARAARVNVPQPQQQQSIDYFVGQWSYRYLGRESALGGAPRDCTLTFTKRADGQSVEGITNCKSDGSTTMSSSLIVFDPATKMMTFTEKLPGNILINSKGDWTSPISIRFTIEPIKANKQALQLRRTYSIVAAHSFTIAEELSEDGGPFVRLGSAVVSKVGAK